MKREKLLTAGFPLFLCQKEILQEEKQKEKKSEGKEEKHQRMRCEERKRRSDVVVIGVLRLHRVIVVSKRRMGISFFQEADIFMRSKTGVVFGDSPDLVR